VKPDRVDLIEELYGLAKAGDWAAVLSSLVAEPELAAACSRYTNPSSGWTLLHEAAHAGQEAVVRALIRLGASTASQTHAHETPADIAERSGHERMVRLLQSAARGAGGPWAPTSDARHLPSSCAWSDAEERRATRDLCVAYAGALVTIPRAARYFVDSFERVLIGWHGTYDPPCGMGGESMLRTG
jgi:hypothetical protein